MYTRAHNSTIHNSQKKETTQMFIYGWKDKWHVVHAHNGILSSPEKEDSTDTGYNVDGSQNQ